MQIYIMLLLKNDIINEKRKTISQKEFLSFASLSSFFYRPCLKSITSVDWIYLLFSCILGKYLFEKMYILVQFDNK